MILGLGDPEDRAERKGDEDEMEDSLDNTEERREPRSARTEEEGVLTQEGTPSLGEE